MRNIKLFEEFSEAKKWKIFAGLGGGFGGANFIKTFTGTESQAEKEAYYATIEEYESYEGLHGLRTVDEIMEEDGIEDYDEAHQVYVDERESWLEYYVKPDDGVKESKEDEERGKRTALSNFPHLQKKDTEKKEKRIKKSHKEDPDGMYPRDDSRYDEPSHQGGWQDGMGVPPWLGESKEFVKIKDPNSLIVGQKYKITWPNYDDYEEGLEPEVEVYEVIGKNKVDGYILKNVEHEWTINKQPNMLADCEIELLEEKAKTPGEKYKGRHIPKKYLTRKKDDMKKEIDEFRGKKSYKADWEADIDRRSGKRIKTKKSAATKAYQKMFGKKEK